MYLRTMNNQQRNEIDKNNNIERVNFTKLTIKSTLNTFMAVYRILGSLQIYNIDQINITVDLTLPEVH